jgi:hypothetical protein
MAARPKGVTSSWLHIQYGFVWEDDKEGLRLQLLWYSLLMYGATLWWVLMAGTNWNPAVWHANANAMQQQHAFEWVNVGYYSTALAASTSAGCSMGSEALLL